MTAVVGILNKYAVAIAADSAVTIGGTNGKKIFNRANKVFTLSKYYPVGILIYNSASFMGTPWETIIKMYRKQLEKRCFPTVKAYKEDFLIYLKEKKYFANEDTQKVFLSNFAYFLIDSILGEIKKVNSLLFDSSTVENQVEILKIFKEKCDNYIIHFAKEKDLCEEILDLPEIEYNNFIAEPFKNIIQSRFINYGFEILEEFELSLKKLIFYYLKIKETNSNFTGLIFTGFGEDDIYPQLIPVNISLAVANRLRHYIDVNNQAIISNDTEGAICPFAQTDVINTILTGIDPTLDSIYLENFEASFAKYNQMIVSFLGTSNPELTAQIKALDVQQLKEEYKKKNDETKLLNYINPLMSAVSGLSKEDLAEMAESLIYLTYLKRRITFAEESVGGPVDVAIISKGDGFIWIKKKHYFKPELNRYFFDNYFNS